MVEVVHVDPIIILVVVRLTSSFRKRIAVASAFPELLTSNGSGTWM